MVLFGENLEGLMHPGWESYYIDYNELKKILAVVIQAETHEQQTIESDRFLTSLLVQTGGVNEFVKIQHQQLSERLEKIQAEAEAVAKLEKTLPVPSSIDQLNLGTALTDLKNEPTSADNEVLVKFVKELIDLNRSFTNLRRFVGTNVIAATKIAKKHDKNVPPMLAKRDLVAAALREMPFVRETALPELCEQTDQLTEETLQRLYPTETASITNRPRKDVDDADAETLKLRALPSWLLAGAAADQADITIEVKDETVTQATRFINTFLLDWKFRRATYEDGLDGPSQTAVSKGDGWNVDFQDSGKQWNQLNCLEKFKTCFINLTKVAFILGFLYFFICSLSFLADGFRLLAGKEAGKVFANSDVFNNPVAGLMVGIFVTVLVQSSSTSTSITITMVGAGLLTVKQAIPVIMGANIGTSVTSTLVALGHGADRNEFRRAFAAATVHDMFNFLSVMIMLPLEAAFNLLYHSSTALVDAYPGLRSSEKPSDILKVITNPFTKFIIQLDKKVISQAALWETLTEQERLDLASKTLMKAPKEGKTSYALDFMYGEWSDTSAGVFVFFMAITILCICLLMIVKLLKSILQGRVAVWLHKTVNGMVPDIHLAKSVEGQVSGGCTVPMGWLSGYLAIACGMGLTILVQSSSITTSALTPLVGVGVISLERMYPTVLGANLGTTITGVLAALAASGDKLQYTLAVAFAHLLFNIWGTVLFYTIWPLRPIPINLARGLGNITAQYRWFPVFYVLLAFFLVPGLFVAISLSSKPASVAVFAIMLIIAAFIATVNYLQKNQPQKLPKCMQTWEFLPLWLRSLEPLDRACCGAFERRCIRKKNLDRSKPVAPNPTDIEIATKRLQGESSPTQDNGTTETQSVADEKTNLVPASE
eukprot:CAMPEP_0175131040 /NCGR_PEP_ID=MMETSP0087-20121206/6324_1 /TAXON_ID=136419 /ORGANISM="Unknown Unknown, Strain D1" /LENGTH=881 /DNA_ID=CAMNT_0016413291 /DNA_START=27 /DNA_END=2672 /DNA_ORIENTATION=-